MIVRRCEPFSQLTVPDHEELDTAALRAIIRRAGCNVDEFAKPI